MRNRLVNTIRNFAIPATLFLASPLLLAQTSELPKAAQSSKAQTAAQASDLSGIWSISTGQPSWDPSDGPGAKPDQLPMTPWAREKFRAARPAFGANQTFENPNDPTEKYCDPPGLTRLYNFPWHFTVVQTPANVFIIFEYFHIWRVVTMDRPHPKDPDSTWLGDSVGKYENGALVIDTIGLNDKSWLDLVGHPHSDALHTVERLTRIDRDTLQLELTIEDPKAYTKSWTSKRMFKRSSEPLGETMCSISEMQNFEKNIMDRTLPSQPAK
jgi:hypothetical protein